MCPHFPVIALSLALALADQTICISQAGWKPHDLGTRVPALARCSSYSSLGQPTGTGVTTALRTPSTPGTAECHPPLPLQKAPQVPVAPAPAAMWLAASRANGFGCNSLVVWERPRPAGCPWKQRRSCGALQRLLGHPARST